MNSSLAPLGPRVRNSLITIEGLAEGVGLGDGDGFGTGLGDGETVGDGEGEGATTVTSEPIERCPRAVTKISVVPARTAETTPVPSTVATELSLEAQTKITPSSSTPDSLRAVALN